MFTSTTPNGKMFIGILLAAAFFLFSTISIASVNPQPNAGQNLTSSLLPFFGRQVNLQTSSKSKLNIQFNSIGSTKYAANPKVEDLFIHSAVSPDGNSLVVLSRPLSQNDNKYNVRVWSADGINLLYSKDNSDPLFFNDSGELTRLRQGSKPNSLETFNPDTGKVISNLPNPKYYDGPNLYESSVFPYLSKDGKILAATYFVKQTDLDTHAVGLWDISSGKYLNSISVPEFNALEFTPDGKYLVIGGVKNQEQNFYSTDSGKNEFAIADKSAIRNSKFIKENILATTNDTQASSNSQDTEASSKVNQIVLWSLKDKQILQQINTDNDGSINDLAYFETNNVLVTGGNDGTIKFYDLTKNVLIQSFNKKENYGQEGGPKSILAVRVWPSYDKLAVFLKNGDVHFYQVNIVRP
jgi:WD40 repeat protein